MSDPERAPAPSSNVIKFPLAVKPLPCPFCGCIHCDVEEDDDEQAWVECQICQARGPVTRVGCRDEDDGEIDLALEATEFWNQRWKAMTDDQWRAVTDRSAEEDHE